MKDYKTFEELKEELGDKFEKYMYEANIELLEKIREASEHLYKRNEQNRGALTNREETIISKHELLRLEIINNNILLEILDLDKVEEK